MLSTFIPAFYAFLTTCCCYATVELEISGFKLLRKRLTSVRVRKRDRQFRKRDRQLRRQLKQYARWNKPQTAAARQPVPTVAITTPTVHVTSPATVRYETEAVSISFSTIHNRMWGNQYCKLINNQICTDFITKLVNLNWNTDLTGVGRDAKGLRHKHIKIHSIHHIQNKPLRRQYVLSYLNSLGRYELPEQLYVLPIATTVVQHLKQKELEEVSSVSDDTQLALDRCLLAKGESFLFHGTDRIAVERIIRDGFNIRYSKRGLFGYPGIYLSEHAQKADQYTDKAERRSTGVPGRCTAVFK